jgi:hypothetical protein
VPLPLVPQAPPPPPFVLTPRCDGRPRRHFSSPPSSLTRRILHERGWGSVMLRDRTCPCGMTAPPASRPPLAPPPWTGIGANMGPPPHLRGAENGSTLGGDVHRATETFRARKLIDLGTNQTPP